MQRIIPLVYLNLVRSRQEHLESYSVPPNHVGKAVATVATSWIKKRHSLSTSADVCLSTTFRSTVSRFHRWVDLDLALLFKKGVGREIAVLEVADKVFSNDQHSRNPVLNFAEDALQVTSPKAPFCVWNFFLESPSLQPGRERYTATTLWCSMAKATVSVVSRHEVSPRLARQCGSQEQRVQANGSNLQVLLNKVRTLGCKSSLKRQTQGRLEGDC